MSIPDCPPSKSQVEKAGKQLRRTFRGELPQEELWQCLEVIERHRQAHARPMLNANAGMRRYAQELGIDVQVTQRLKRMQTIIEKVAERESGMNLARMRDIGGVRVIVGDLDALRRVPSLGAPVLAQAGVGRAWHADKCVTRRVRSCMECDDEGGRLR